MPLPALTRRLCLLLPLVLAACGEERKNFPPLNYSFLTPIRLNVADVEVEQRFIPSGVDPDVTNQDPIPPVEALRGLARDRFQAFGSSGRATFVIRDASLIKQKKEILGVMDVQLNVFTRDGQRGGFAEARVTQRHSGDIDDLRGTLYDMTKAMTDDMNVELEYQIRRNLKDWLVSEEAAPTPVDQAPLEKPDAAPAATSIIRPVLPGAAPTPLSPPMGVLVPPPGAR